MLWIMEEHKTGMQEQGVCISGVIQSETDSKTELYLKCYFRIGRD